MSKSRSQTTRKRARRSNNLSQDEGNAEESEHELNIDDEVNKCVRYILSRGSNDVPIRKDEIVKNALPGRSRQFDLIMQQVTNILSKIYGVCLAPFEDGTVKYYVALCKFPQPEGVDNDRKDDANKVLIMLVLTHLFMSNDIVPEASLTAFLENLNINFNTNHELFGNVKDFVNVTMVKQKYIKTCMDEVTRKLLYTWGPRAEATISKQKILEFAGTIYGKNPAVWNAQDKVASKQELVIT